MTTDAYEIWVSGSRVGFGVMDNQAGAALAAVNSALEVMLIHNLGGMNMRIRSYREEFPKRDGFYIGVSGKKIANIDVFMRSELRKYLTEEQFEETPRRITLVPPSCSNAAIFLTERKKLRFLTQPNVWDKDTPLSSSRMRKTQDCIRCSKLRGTNVYGNAKRVQAEDSHILDRRNNNNHKDRDSDTDNNSCKRRKSRQESCHTEQDKPCAEHDGLWHYLTESE